MVQTVTARVIPTDWLGRFRALSVAAGALGCFVGAAMYFFCQDDFAGLARTSGVAGAAGVWRYVSHTLFYDVVYALAGLRAGYYHGVILACHAVNALFVLALLQRRVGALGAWVGATFFATHPVVFRAVYWISAGADVLALFFVLAAWLAYDAGGRWRWASLPLFALSLFAKESTILWPLVLVVDARWRRDVDRRVLAGLAAVAVMFVCVLLLDARARGQAPLPTGEAYGVSLDLRAEKNLLTYIGWVVSIPAWLMRDGNDVARYDSIRPGSVPIGALILLVWVAGNAVRSLRERGWHVAGCAFLLLLLPVVPLGHHTYRYYLYAPLVGAAWCVAALVDIVPASFRQGAPLSRRQRRASRRNPMPATPRGGGGTPRWILGGALCALLVANGVIYVRRMEAIPLPVAPLPADHTIRRARMVERMHGDVRRAQVPQNVTLAFWSPAAVAYERSRGNHRAGRDGRTTIWEQNMEAGLGGGIGAKVLFPQIRSVRFVQSFEPTTDSVWYAIYDIDGRTDVRRASEVARLLSRPQ